MPGRGKTAAATKPSVLQSLASTELMLQAAPIGTRSSRCPIADQPLPRDDGEEDGVDEEPDEPDEPNEEDNDDTIDPSDSQADEIINNAADEADNEALANALNTELADHYTRYTLWTVILSHAVATSTRLKNSADAQST
ncbi:hypothetical protein OQA88_12582 [Cercophora sp. LCS_1]